MRNFVFENIWLLSRRDQRGISVTFHPRKTLLLGQNHTGKSSIIKNLFLTLGARPTGKLQSWDDSTISLVTFTIQGRRYRALHQTGYRALFDDEDRLIAAASSHAEWTPIFASAIGLNLVLTDKELQTVPADARCFFLPFYINQDGSWGGSWDTFTGMAQYKSPVGAILDYFSGVKPPEYYEVSSKRVQTHRQLEELQKEARFLARARERFGNALPLSGPKLESENFELEIARLTHEVTELNARQEKLRDVSVREEELLATLQAQIRLAMEALATYDRDASFLRDPTRARLVCPTCGAEHEESFGEILTYAEDARVLRELLARLRLDATKAADQHRRTQLQLDELNAHYRRVSSILETRRGELEFRDVVNSIGAERAFRTFEDEAILLKQEVDGVLSELGTLDVRLKELADASRSKEILELFRRTYAWALSELNLPPMNVSRQRLASRPNVSGSGGPRSALAYYAALWYTCRSKHAAFSVPLVVDAPNQQGQDKNNLPKVLDFLSSHLPDGCQVIVGSEIDTPRPFDSTILLGEKYKLLKERDYGTVSHALEPLVRSMYEALRENGVV